MKTPAPANSILNTIATFIMGAAIMFVGGFVYVIFTQKNHRNIEADATSLIPNAAIQDNTADLSPRLSDPAPVVQAPPAHLSLDEIFRREFAELAPGPSASTKPVARGESASSGGTFPKQFTERNFSSRPAAATAKPEWQIAACLKQVFETNAQKLFLEIHPVGTARNIKINDVTITNWSAGESRTVDDVRQFTVTYTIYWKSPLIDDGFTKAIRAFDVEVDRWLDPKVLTTNGTTNAQVGDGAKEFIGGFAEGFLKGLIEQR
jgi:hypothetical protein